MPRDKSGNAKKKSEDRETCKPPPKDVPAGRERNVKPTGGEEHSRVRKGNRT